MTDESEHLPDPDPRLILARRAIWWASAAAAVFVAVVLVWVRGFYA